MDFIRDKKLLRLLAKHERARLRKLKAVRTPALTAKQRTFAEAFCSAAAAGNATKAARLAGYRWPGKVGPALVYHPLVNKVINDRIDLLKAAARGPMRAGLLTFGPVDAY